MEMKLKNKLDKMSRYYYSRQNFKIKKKKFIWFVKSSEDTRTLKENSKYSYRRVSRKGATILYMFVIQQSR